MNGPGKVFSRPMSRPTIFSVSDVLIDHLPPVRPVMSPTIPQMELDGHTLLPYHSPQPLGVPDVRVTSARPDKHLRFPLRTVLPIVLHIRTQREPLDASS